MKKGFAVLIILVVLPITITGAYLGIVDLKEYITGDKAAAEKAEKRQERIASDKRTERRYTSASLDRLIVFEDTTDRWSYGSDTSDGYSYSYEGGRNVYYEPPRTTSYVNGSQLQINISNRTRYTTVTVKGTIKYRTLAGSLNGNGRWQRQGCFLCYKISPRRQTQTFSIEIRPGNSNSTSIYSEQERFGTRRIDPPINESTVEFSNVGYFVNGRKVD